MRHAAKIAVVTGSVGTPEEIDEAAVFLAGDAASFVTDEVFTGDGGWSACGFV